MWTHKQGIKSWKILSRNQYSDQTQTYKTHEWIAMMFTRSTSSELCSEREEAVVAEDRGVRHQLKLLYSIMFQLNKVYIHKYKSLESQYWRALTSLLLSLPLNEPPVNNSILKQVVVTPLH